MISRAHEWSALGTYAQLVVGDHVGAVRSSERIVQLMDAVERRGECHHPDGTTRSIRAMLRAFPLEVDMHLSGSCTAAAVAVPAGAR